MGIVGMSGFRIKSPSTADETEMGGVIIPSAKRKHPPMIAGQIRNGFLRFTRVKSEKIPPSPLLSAFKTNNTYLMVV
jgi:hypothetical protein